MPAQVLKLTGIIRPGDSPGIFVGYIKEIRGIIAQGSSVDEVYDDLVETTRGMLDFKREEAIKLLAEQTHSTPTLKASSSVEFDLELVK